MRWLVGVQIPPSAPHKAPAGHPGGSFLYQLTAQVKQQTVPSKPSLAARRFLKTRQLVLLAAVVVCAVFAVSYSGRTLSGMQVDKKLDNVKHSVAEQQQWQADISKSIDDAGSPAAIERFARDELNLIKPGDQAVVTVPGKGGETGAIAQVGEVAAPAQPQAPEPNWKLWWRLIAPSAPAR